MPTDYKARQEISLDALFMYGDVDVETEYDGSVRVSFFHRRTKAYLNFTGEDLDEALVDAFAWLERWMNDRDLESLRADGWTDGDIARLASSEHRWSMDGDFEDEGWEDRTEYDAIFTRGLRAGRFIQRQEELFTAPKFATDPVPALAQALAAESFVNEEPGVTLPEVTLPVRIRLNIET